MSLFILDRLETHPDQPLVVFLDGAGWHKAFPPQRNADVELKFHPIVSAARKGRIGRVQTGQEDRQTKDKLLREKESRKN